MNTKATLKQKLLQFLGSQHIDPCSFFSKPEIAHITYDDVVAFLQLNAAQEQRDNIIAALSDDDLRAPDRHQFFINIAEGMVKLGY